MKNSQKPLARTDNLVIQDLPDEVLVYDLNTNKAHCLNQSAMLVWKACNGDKTVSEISELFSKQTGNSVDENFIWLAIDQLSEKNLLENGVKPVFTAESRRSVIKKIGMAAVVALPVVASLTAPTSVLALVSCAGCTGAGIPCAPLGCPPGICDSNGICAVPPPPFASPA